MMNCKEVQPNLFDYGKNKLSTQENSMITEHLSKCKSCRAILDAEMDLSDILSQIPSEIPQKDVWPTINRQTQSINIFNLARLRGVLVTVFAAFIIVLVIITFRPDTQKTTYKRNNPENTIVVKWSDDPLGSNTDTLVSAIDDM